MSRYLEQVNPNNVSQKEKKENSREMKKPGTYTSEDLSGAKKIPTKEGYK